MITSKSYLLKLLFKILLFFSYSTYLICQILILLFQIGVFVHQYLLYLLEMILVFVFWGLEFLAACLAYQHTIGNRKWLIVAVFGWLDLTRGVISVKGIRILRLVAIFSEVLQDLRRNIWTLITITSHLV